MASWTFWYITIGATKMAKIKNKDLPQDPLPFKERQ